mmetsp:Transcript_46038/g.72124  ORF Transcript_46038/g.72124 Transcript_46038/m.72124 type:complete len:82 (+) Transcript_46038:1179-1424(+)
MLREELKGRESPRLLSQARALTLVPARSIGVDGSPQPKRAEGTWGVDSVIELDSQPAPKLARLAKPNREARTSGWPTGARG